MFSIAGSISAQTTAIRQVISVRLRAGVEAAATATQAELRAQARAAGFRDGGRAIAGAWRKETFPRAGVSTWRPAALVWSKAPTIVEAFSTGVAMQMREGKYFVIPTAINRIPGRRGRGGARAMRVTPQEMIRSRRAFIRPAKAGGAVKLWCLPVVQKTTKRGRLRVYAGRYAEVLTGNVKGRQARREALAQQGAIAMFILMPRVQLSKRLDFEGAAQRGRARLVTEIRRAVGA